MTQKADLNAGVSSKAIAAIIATFDAEIYGHSPRVQTYLCILAEALRSHPRFAAFLAGRDVSRLAECARVHDVGKAGIPPEILTKDGRLTPAEFEIVKTHATMGGDTIAAARSRLGTDTDLLRVAEEMARFHHEKWDGSGYPTGLAGDAIPPAARLMAVADVFDALTSRRAYKRALSPEAAAEVIFRGRAVHFDPDIVDAFALRFPEIALIARGRA